MSIAIAAIGTQLKRGDGGSSAAVAASRTVGSSNSKLRLTAVTPGTGGNSITYSVVAAGNNTPLSIGVVGSAITINVETDGSAASVSTVNDVIAKIYATAAARALVDADDSDGDGTGVLAAAGSAALSGGSNSTEVFTLIPGITDLGGPNRSRELIDVTSHDSEDLYREFIVGLKDGGQITGELNYSPANAQHLGINTDFEDDVLRNFQMLFRDNTLVEFSAYVESFEITASPAEQLKASFAFKITGPVVITPA